MNIIKCGKRWVNLDLMTHATKKGPVGASNYAGPMPELIEVYFGYTVEEFPNFIQVKAGEGMEYLEVVLDQEQRD